MPLITRNSRAVPAVLLTTLVLVAGGCGGGSAPQSDPEPAPPPDRQWPDRETGFTFDRPDCDPLPGATVRGGSFTVVLTDSVAARRAPLPGNEAERVLFAQLYETLLGVDCAGRVVSGLAETWTRSPDGSSWILELRPGARFWDGTRITATAVCDSWERDTGRREELLPYLARSGFQAVALDDRRLRVRATALDDLPRLLAHPALAVAVNREGWHWPVGSGPARLQASTPPPLPEVVCRPNPGHPDAPRWEQLTFQIRPGADPRDLVGLRADLLLTRDTVVARFYNELHDYDAVTLPWDRLYLLVLAGDPRRPTAEAWREAAIRLDPDQDLTLVDARDWHLAMLPGVPELQCRAGGVPTPDPGGVPRDSELADVRLDGHTVVYADDAPGAGELARRLAALAGSRARSHGLSPAGFALALRWEMSGAHVLTVDLEPGPPCLQRDRFLLRAPWLAPLAGTEPVQGESLGVAERLDRPREDPLRELVNAGALTPLAVSRRWLLARAGLAGVALAHDGVPLLAGLGVAVAETVP